MLLFATLFVAVPHPAAPRTSAWDRLRFRGGDEVTERIERAAAPALLFEARVGRVLCGEIVRIERREPWTDSVLWVRARYRALEGTEWVFADEEVAVRFGELASVDFEFENALDFHLFLSSRDERAGPIGSREWRRAMDRAMDPSGVLGLAHVAGGAGAAAGDGNGPEVESWSEPGRLIARLTAADEYAPVLSDEDMVRFPVRRSASSFDSTPILTMIDGLVGAEDRGADAEALWADVSATSDYLFGLRRVVRRGDAGFTPTEAVDRVAQRIELYSVAALRELFVALSGAYGVDPLREDAVEREALLAAIEAHVGELTDGPRTVAAWERLLDAPSSTVWPDAILPSPDRSRRAAWALRLVRACPSLWAAEDDPADLRDTPLDVVVRPLVDALLVAASRRLDGTGRPLPAPRMRDTLHMGERARAAEYLQLSLERTPVQLDAVRTLAAYLVEKGHPDGAVSGFEDAAFARRRDLALAAFVEALSASRAGSREAALITMLEVGDRRVLATPDAVRSIALSVEHGLGLETAPGSAERRWLEDRLIALCLFAGQYGPDAAGPAAPRVRAALANGMDLVSSRGEGRAVLLALGLEVPTRVAGQGEAFERELLARMPGFCAEQATHLRGRDPAEALISLRTSVAAALGGEEGR